MNTPKTVRNGMKLRTKFLLSFMLIIMLTVTMIVTIIYNVSVSTMKRNTADYSQFLIEQIGINLDKRTKDIEDFLFQQFRSSLLHEEVEVGEGTYLSVIRDKQITDYLSELLYSQEHFESVLFFDSHDRSYKVERLAGLVENSGLLDDFRLEDVKINRGRGVWLPSNLNTVYVAKALYGLSTGAYAGTIVLGVDGDHISSIYQKINQLTSGNVLILNASNRLIVRDSGISDLADYFMEKRLFEETPKKGFPFNGQSYIYTTLSQGDDKWKIIQIISVEQLTAGVNVIKVWTFTTIALSILLAFLLAAYMSKSITENVRMLLHSMTIFSKDFSHKVIVPTSRDEVGLLAEKFNSMAEKINELINSIYKEKLLKQKAEYRTLQFEYKALQAQINPHFLYNTLESIYSLAKLRGEHQIGEMVYLLGSLLRESISKKGDVIYLHEEIAFIQKYLSIHKLIYEEKIEVSYDLDESLMECSVPKFILQPLVENSIVHGIEEKPGKGLVCIACRAEERDLVIEVTDNGIGIEKETAERLLHPKYSEENKAKDNHTNVGMISVHKRIRILYGDDYGLTILSEPGQGTTIQVRLPIIMEGEAYEKNSGDY